MKKPKLHQTHSKLIPSLALVFALPWTFSANAETIIFNTAGTTDWICPPGVTEITVECWGGGGAGGGTYVTAAGSANAGGGAGGGGAYAKLNAVPVTPTSTYSINIPDAAICPGTANSFTNSQRFDGSPVTFTGDGSVSVSANGGQGGQCRIVSTATASSGSNGAGGAAGTGLDATFAGGTSAQWGGGNGNGGGGGAGDLGDGGAASAASGSFGVGGSGSDAAHTGGNGGAARNGAGTGNAASSPSGGGGGAKSTATSKGWRAGGAGGLGKIILTFTVPPAPSKTKANNSVALNSGGSWVGGVAPNSTEVANWDSTVTSPNSTLLGADLTWAGISVVDPTGLVTIGAGNSLTLGAAGIDIDMSTASSDLTLNCPLTMGGENVWDVNPGQTLTMGGAVSGDFPLTLQGGGTVRLGSSNVLPSGIGNGNVTVDGNLDLNTFSEDLNGLSGSGIIDTVAGGTPTLTVGQNDQSGTFSGVIQNTTGTLSLTKVGTGTQALGGANTLSGSVSITGGTLSLDNIAPLDSVSGIALGDGTILRTGFTSTNINAPITLGAASSIATITAPLYPPNNVGATTRKTVDLDGVISGAGDLILTGVNGYNQYGQININVANDYTGSTLITTASEYDGAPPNNANIFVRLGVNDALPATTVLTLDGGDGGGSGVGRYCELNLAGNSQTLAGLQNTPGRVSRLQRIINSGAAATLTVNNEVEPYTFSGELGWVAGVGSATDSNFGLTKSGAGVFTLSGNNTYTGATTITGGTLALGASTALTGSSTIALGAATLDVGAAISATTTGTLDCTGAATINLGDATSAIALADSSALTWTGALNITGTFVSGASLRFGDGTGDGLSVAQLAQITASGFTGFALDASGYLTATGAGGFASWITGTFANGTVTNQGPDDDDDNDGISNLVEYAVAGQDPTVANPNISTYNAGTLSFTKAAGTSGLTYAIQESTDLGISDAWAEVTGGSYVNDATTISFTLTPGTPVKNFLRLQVISN